jgi:hypothetical protein
MFSFNNFVMKRTLNTIYRAAALLFYMKWAGNKNLGYVFIKFAFME